MVFYLFSPLQVSKWYDLVIFTASMEIYGAAVADKLDNNRGILTKRYYRQVLLFYCQIPAKIVIFYYFIIILQK